MEKIYKAGVLQIIIHAIIALLLSYGALNLPKKYNFNMIYGIMLAAFFIIVIFIKTKNDFGKKIIIKDEYLTMYDKEKIIHEFNINDYTYKLKAGRSNRNSIFAQAINKDKKLVIDCSFLFGFGMMGLYKELRKKDI